eukprot:14385353-Heterocapsa_arctica.AAC.1
MFRQECYVDDEFICRSLGSNLRKLEEPYTKRGDGGGRAGGFFSAKLEKTKIRRQLRHGQPE